ncbi:MAG: hypothetical protein IPP20_00765 [Gemmatimonadetes bacterium]|nr:hypothetical protein [Gemmatimonadota bacterium]
MRDVIGGGRPGRVGAGVMRRLALAVVTCLTFMPAAARGQEKALERPAERSPGRTPEFLFQPGMLSADFVSAPEGYPSTSGFNLRFSTLVPTSSKWWTLIVGASVTPYGTSGITPRSTNTPVLFVGNVFPGIAARRTGGWLELQFPFYLTYTYGGGGPRNRAIYGRDFVAEAALQVHVGQKVLRELGPAFARLRLYAMVNQVITPNEDPTSGRTDRFNPMALYGITIPIGRHSTER